MAGINRDPQKIVNGGLWYNTDAFALPERGCFGNAGRNIILSPRDWNVDSGLFQNVNISERIKAQYRWEVFNALNHANLNGPQGNINNGSAGEIQTLSGPRIPQMGLCLTF